VKIHKMKINNKHKKTLYRILKNILVNQIKKELSHRKYNKRILENHKIYRLKMKIQSIINMIS